MYKVNEPVNFVKFNKEYYPLIKDGVKTQTMRKANKRLDVHEGDIVKAIFPGTDLSLRIRITKIGYKQLKSIRIEDAIREGYNEIAELKNELLKIYPELNKWDRLYYYRFILLEE